MADSVLTDAELRDELKRLGFDPGPVTASTRSLYVRKLNTLKSGKKLVAKKSKIKPVAKRPLIGFSSDESDEEEAKSNWRKGRSRPAGSTQVNDNGVGSLRPRGLKLTQRNNSNMKYTIQDDDVDSSLLNLKQNEARPNPASLFRDKLPRNRRSLGNNIQPASSSTTRRSGRRSLQVVGSLLSTTSHRPRLTRSNSNATGSKEDDFSDSDVDEKKDTNGEDESASLSTSNIFSRTFLRNSPMSSKQQAADEETEVSRPSNPPSNRPSPLISSSTKSLTQSVPHASTPVKLNRSFERDTNNDSTTSEHTSVTGARTRPLRRRATKDKGANHVATCNHVDEQSYSKPSNTTSAHELETEFQTEENITATWGTKYGHYVSMMLLAFVFLFFVTLTVVYLSMVGTDNETPTVLQICENPKSLCGFKGNHIVAMVHILNKGLGNVAGNHLCGTGVGEFSQQYNMSLSDASRYLKAELEKTPEGSRGAFLHFEDMLKHIIIHPEWGIRVYNDEGALGYVAEDFKMENVSWLESLYPIMPLKCRILRSIYYVFFRLFLLGSVIFLVWSIYVYIKYRQMKEEEELGQMYQLVDRIIEFLQTNGDKCQAIPHVRDRLIPPSERKERQRVWLRAVKYINSEESRVRVETQSIVGEVFSTWRWLQPQSTVSFTPMTETDMKPGKIKVWQGQAFENLDSAVKTAPGIYTQFLKIRNMFDQSLESNSNEWQVEIEDAILDKVGDGVRILHIAVDKNSREGCVYCKVETPVQASYAYRALQGSWFDGRLVTVKYLKSDRYYYRFPPARDMVTALVPSTSQKQSLSSMDFSRPTIEST
ncbi:inner nuclear membrane protein Man1-like [Anneissia japonica]|uniref:inner nuclear membrane protein Man1-like n=1 Tax=Anneissia japonica TaxID=1529436 RepID=UPI0014256973|nr:inner nuclear membrane protein Man1-like [Anneissia japonica]